MKTIPLLFRLLAVALWSGVVAASAQSLALPAREDFHLFLLIGQSNMAGRGAITPGDKEPHPRVLMLDQTGQWVPAVDPLHFDKPIAGVGLGRTFGIEIAKAAPGVTVGLVPCAVGGSLIDTWQPGVFYDATKSHPWDDALRRTEIALQIGTLKGILWHQGESDSKPDFAPVYEAKLHELIARLRAAFGTPNVPFLAGQMGRFDDAPWDESRRHVDRVHRELPANVPYTAFVSADRLKHKGDKVHFDADSYREFGRRYAEAYLKLAREK